jgi:hypothetical protein
MLCLGPRGLVIIDANEQGTLGLRRSQRAADKK